MQQKTLVERFPFYGWLGIFLVIVFWILNWSLDGLRTQWGFFPLWLGYCLTVEGLVFVRKGTSLLKRNLFKYACLFLISAPSWWLFEFLNSFTKNWYYDGRQYFTSLQYFLLASLSFSTVMPAVFGTAELASTFKWIKNLPQRKHLKINKSLLAKFFAAGIAMFLLIIFIPEYFYYLIWVSLYFIIEPVNYLMRNKTLLKFFEAGDWRPFVSLSIGCLISGFFWEFWNFNSYPKWIYNLPNLNILHIFEMPLPGYIGYIPFSIELFALYHLTIGIFRKEDLEDYIQLI